MKSKIGVNRVSSRIRFLVADFLQHRLSDPRQGFTTVTKVELTPDYRFCKIHVSIMGDPGEQSRVLHMLEDATGRIQAHVASNLNTRVAPKLTFVHDQSLEKSARMDSLFNQIARERGDDDASDDAADRDDDDQQDRGESS